MRRAVIRSAILDSLESCTEGRTGMELFHWLADCRVLMDGYDREVVAMDRELSALIVGGQVERAPGERFRLAA